MQRVRGAHVAAVLPAYDNPLDPLTEDAGFFEKDASLAPTQLTADWANHVQEELCSLVEVLGGTPEDASDAQLSSAIGPALASVKIPHQASEGFALGSGFAIDGFLAASSSTADSTWLIPMRVPVGARITALGAYATETGEPDAAEKAQVQVVRKLGTGSITAVGAAAVTGWGTSFEAQEDPLSAEHTVEANYSYFIRAFIPATWDGSNFSLQSATVTVDLHGDIS